MQSQSSPVVLCQGTVIVWRPKKIPSTDETGDQIERKREVGMDTNEEGMARKRTKELISCVSSFLVLT